MSAVLTRDLSYGHGATVLEGLVLDCTDAGPRPTVLLVPDAFGLGGFSLEQAHRYARLGYTVVAADMWGDRLVVHHPDEIGPLIGAALARPDDWHGRIHAALDAARAQPEVDADRIAVVGYCFGGSTALELARTGGAVRAVVGIHSGLDLLDPAARWAPAHRDLRVLLCTGADDPMATSAQRSGLQLAMTDAGVDWEVDLYSGTVHAFTNPHPDPSPRPETFAFHPRSAARAWDRTVRFLAEALATSQEHEVGHE